MADLPVSLTFHQPLPVSSDPANPIHYLQNSRVLGYSHKISAVGGFDTASIEMAVGLNDIADWIANGLARHVVVTGHGGVVAWEGFVNQVDATIGGSDITIGPLMAMANKVKVKYQTISWDIPDTPIRGIAKETGYANDEDSQSLYFILEEIVNIGEASESLGQPTDVRAHYLSENSWPRSGQAFSIGSPSEPRVSVSCLGYYHLLKKFYYSNAGASSSVNASQKILDVVTADPNSIVDTNNTILVEENTTPVSDHEEGESTGWDVITSTISYGTSSNNLYIVGLTDNRVLYGREISSTIASADYELQIARRSPGVFVYKAGGSIPPPLVRPGKWAFISDLDIGAGGISAELDPAFRHPRYMFIDSVDYDLGGGLTLSSTKLDTVDQAIARIGLEGLYR